MRRKTARAAGRCRGGIRRAGIRGPRGACGVERLQEIRGEGTPAVVLAVYGWLSERRSHNWRRSSPSGDSFPWRPGLSWATLVQHARHADRRRTSRCAGPRRSSRFRSAHRPKACARRDRPDRRRKTPRTAYAAVVKTAVHPFVLGTAGGRNALRPYCSPRATPHGAPNAAAASRSVPRRRSRAATNCTPTRRAASAAVHVKGCAFGARTFETPFAAVLARNFARRKPPVTIM